MKTVTCALTAAILCSWFTSTEAALQLYGSFRRDVYLKDFPESGCKTPSAGGRVHIVISGIEGVSNVGEFSSVTINGQEGLHLDTSSSADLT